MSSLRELIPTILEKSRELKLDWDELSETSFGSALGNLVITIDRGTARSARTGNQIPRYKLSLRNQGGSVIDSVSATSDKDFELLKEIFEFARRRAYKVEESLTELKDILGNL